MWADTDLGFWRREYILPRLHAAYVMNFVTIELFHFESRR